jgi:branched-chain amino acid transport system substrate-binding protein
VQKASPDLRLFWRYLLLILLVGFGIVACNRIPTDPPSSNNPVSPTVVEIEVTRVVEVVVTPTPQPMSSSCEREKLASADEVVIGALLPLSRPGAMLTGFAMQAAFSLAVDDLNANGGIAGRPVRLVTYDTANYGQWGTQLAERLITLDCAALLVGGHHADVAYAIKEVAHQHGVPVIFPSVMSDNLTADQYPEVFRISPSLSLVEQMPAKWLTEVGDYNQDGKQFVLVLSENTTENQDYGKRILNWIRMAGIDAEQLTIELPTTNFSPIIARIVALNIIPDAIIIAVPGEPALPLHQQMVAAGIGPQGRTLLVNNTNALNSPNFWSLVPAGVFAVLPRIGPWPTAVSTSGAAFVERFRAYFERWPDYQAFAAYDAIHLAGDAIARADSLEPAAIIAALEASDIELTLGHYYFPYGSANPPDGTTTPTHWWHQWPDFPLLYLQYTSPGQAPTAAPVIWPMQYRTAEQPVLSQPDLP